MNAMEAFRWWVAMRNHFTQKKFDVWKTRNHLTCSAKALVARRDYKCFESVATLFDGKTREYVMFLAANNMYGFSNMIYDTVSGVENYNTFIMRLRYLSNIVESDFYKIARHCRKPTQPAEVLRLLTAGEITFETCVVIQKLRPSFFKRLEGTSVFMVVEPLLLRIEKSIKFVKVDDTRRAYFERLIDKLKILD